MMQILSELWHAIRIDEAAQRLEADVARGLDREEVRRRQQQFGLNRFTPKHRTGPLKRFLLQFHQPLVYILLASTVVTLFLHEWVESAVIFGVILVNAIVGYMQEAKAERAIEALSAMVLTEATVRREGEVRRIPAVELVPGDVVLLQSGDRVPADMRLSKVRSLQVDESPLTGESVPVMKTEEVLPGATGLADRKNLSFAGTAVTYGQAEGLVYATGDRTETGKIAWLINEAANLETPLTRKIAHFSHLLLYVILVLAVVAFVVGVLHGEKASEMFMAAIALAVGAIPEGLPAAVTIVLAIGVSRMAARRAIIRKLPAVETLGSTSVICSDKTGTLTKNQMTVREVFASNAWYEVSGTGYDPEGVVTCQALGIDAASRPALLECLTCGLLCNDSQLLQEQGQWKVQGDPTEAALIVSARKGKLEAGDLLQKRPRLDAIPFESQHQYMATLHDAGEGQPHTIYLKGAVERILARCTKQLDDNGQTRELDGAGIIQAAEKMAAKGLRVLAFASGTTQPDKSQVDHPDVERDLTFLGLQGMIDPPRPEAIAAVAKCRNAGIAVKMITGDHARTGEAVAQQMGLAPQGVGTEVMAVSGADLERMDGPALKEAAMRGVVFARVAPEQKLRLVEALQAQGHVVAMTGDGVNDAPALKQADIGIAMGITGTDVAKDAADMLLTDDNFATIEAAVEEGRSVFENLTKFIVWTLPTNGGEALVVLAAIFAGAVLPVLPIHLLWINMTTAILLGTTLVFEPKENEMMLRPPRDPKEPILTGVLLFRTALVSTLVLIGAYGLFLWEIHFNGASLAEARTVAVNMIVMAEVAYLFNCRSLKRSMFAVGLFSNRWIYTGVAGMLLCQGIFTYWPVMNRLFETEPLGVGTWLRILAFSLLIYGVIETEKWFRAHRGRSR